MSEELNKELIEIYVDETIKAAKLLGAEFSRSGFPITIEKALDMAAMFRLHDALENIHFEMIDTVTPALDMIAQNALPDSHPF